MFSAHSQRSRRLVVSAALFAISHLANADPSGLEIALKATLSNSPILQGKYAELSSGGFSADAARAERYPTLSAQAEQGLNNAEEAIISFRARQPLWAFGRIDSNIAAAERQLDVESADTLRIQRQLMEQTATIYARVKGADLKLTIADENIAAHELFYQQIKRRHKGQLASGADVNLAATRLAQAKAQHAQYQSERDVYLNQLQSLTLSVINTQEEVTPHWLTVPGLPRLRREFEQHHADVLVKEKQVQRAAAGVHQAKTAAYPTLYFQVEHDYDYHSDADDTRTGLVLEAQLEGLGFAARGRTKAAAEAKEAALFDLQNTRNDVNYLASRLYHQLVQQKGLLATYAQVVDDLQSLLASYQRQYETGSKTWQDVLNIQRELSGQLLQKAQTHTDGVIYALQIQTLRGAFDHLLNQENSHD